MSYINDSTRSNESRAPDKKGGGQCLEAGRQSKPRDRGGKVKVVGKAMDIHQSGFSRVVTAIN
jgi:hypothetical protein